LGTQRDSAARFPRISWVSVAFKAVSLALMIGTPAAAVWLASSLAAFANRAPWLPVAAGLLLFPGLPLAWEGSARLREHGAAVKVRRRHLTFLDRLVLRTLAINVLFLVVLLAAFPARAFVALSARGDWMLDGHHGPAAERTRRALLTCAGAIEWLYRASNDNPYRDGKDGRSDGVEPQPTPPPVPVPTGTALPSATPVPPLPPVPPVDPPPAAADPLHYPFPATLHPLVASMPAEAEVSIESVGRYIASREPDPVLRVKALHDWVADRIAYDTPAYVAHAIPPADGNAQAVFRTRIGVCAGYAKLLAALGKVTGDEILYVVGDARSEESPMEGESHAWNAVKLHGSWYLVDATWDAGSSDGAAFKKKYGTAYLFTPPDQFAISHFPDAPKWQLLERPLTRAEFFRRPVLAPAFFANGLELRAPDRSQVAVAGALDVSLGNPRNVFVLADFTPKHGGPRVDCRGDRHTTVHCDFQTPGTYDVTLYANAEQYGSYTYVGSVEVNARP
jgi:transglutaminase-like putative cysteine protease